MKLTRTNLKKTSAALIFVTSVLAIFLSILVYYHPVMNFDISVSRGIQAEGGSGFRYTALTLIFDAVSYLGRTNVAIWIVLFFALLFWIKKYYWENLFCLLTLSSAVINSVIKFIIGRPRPSGSLVNILDHQMSPSYPSGHVVFFTVFYGFLFTSMFFTKRIPTYLRYFIASLSVVLIVLVSLSRIYLGAHWLTDVVAGYLVGIMLLTFLLYYYLRSYIQFEK